MVSVIIATRNRADILKYCLDSLLKQDAGNDQFEIIVADNNSTDNTKQVVANYSSNHPHIKYICETTIGSSAPRNTGMGHARYEWLAFIDDDGWVEENFISEIISVIRNNDFACFGGWFIPWYKEPKFNWMKDEWFSYPKYLDQTGELPASQDNPCGIFIIKKEYLQLVGGFPLDLGIINGAMGFAEENWVQAELRKRKLKVGFDPKLVLHHLVAAPKYHYYWHLQKSYKKAKDWQKIKPKLSAPEKIKRITKGSAAAVFLLAKNLPKLLFNKNYYRQNYMIDSLSFTCRMYGSVSG